MFVCLFVCLFVCVCVCYFSADALSLLVLGKIVTFTAYFPGHYFEVHIGCIVRFIYRVAK